MNLFKGYVLTKDKKCIEKFKNRTDFKSYDQIKNLPEYAGILAEDIILVDIDDFEQSEILLKICEDYESKGYFCPHQFENASNVTAHFDYTEADFKKDMEDIDATCKEQTKFESTQPPTAESQE